MQISVRFLTKLYIKEVIWIDSRTNPFPWGVHEFDSVMGQKNVAGSAAQDAETGAIIGFIIYEMTPKAIVVRRLAVDPDFQRRRIGTALLARTMNRTDKKRAFMRTRVREDNMIAHLFLRSCHWTAVGVNREDCPDGRDSYTFAWASPTVAPLSRS